MDGVDLAGNSRRSEILETVGIHCSSSTIADTLDLAVRQPASAVCGRALDRLSGRWTFLSMPQDVNLVAYGKQFSGEWPSFRVEMDCDGVVNAMPTFALTKDSANEEAQDRGKLLSGADEKNPSAPSRPNTFVEQCVAYVGRVFSWDFYRTVYLFFLPIVTFRNRR
ncbi:unnamed protein product [Macrosiphum euphorbiae]|uniref:Uncharacterized protein n=1 Tax=Macrosiphum euphorbiae TaxID=13131 RepID=A0AAV0W324_9HEMI|nr:unnamed protein product [Macrosiphum euphorbiae]